MTAKALVLVCMHTNLFGPILDDKFELHKSNLLSRQLTPPANLPLKYLLQQHLVDLDHLSFENWLTHPDCFHPAMRRIKLPPLTLDVRSKPRVWDLLRDHISNKRRDCREYHLQLPYNPAHIEEELTKRKQLQLTRKAVKQYRGFQNYLNISKRQIVLYKECRGRTFTIYELLENLVHEMIRAFLCLAEDSWSAYDGDVCGKDKMHGECFWAMHHFVCKKLCEWIPRLQSVSHSPTSRKIRKCTPRRYTAVQRVREFDEIWALEKKPPPTFRLEPRMRASLKGWYDWVDQKYMVCDHSIIDE